MTVQGNAASGLSNATLEAATNRLDTWIARNGHAGYDPHDALNSPLLRRLTFGSRWVGVAWLQAVRRCPLNLRPLLAIRPSINPKAMGLFLATAIRRYRLSGEQTPLEYAEWLKQWLASHASPGYSGPCWGYPFDWPNRAFRAPRNTPTIVNTAFIADALLDLHQETGEQDSLRLARGACDFLMRDLALIKSPKGVSFSYTPLDRRIVHNASLLGAGLLARVATVTGEQELRNLAEQVTRFTIACQREDGSWPYGEAVSDGWVDSFHTGFVIVSLHDLSEWLQDSGVLSSATRGYEFWKQRCILPDGAPRWSPARTYPIDVHAAAQAILTFLRFRGADPEALALANRSAAWAIANLQDESGYFHYQILSRYRNRIPYLRWGQAWMQRALWELRLATSIGAIANRSQTGATQ